MSRLSDDWRLFVNRTLGRIRAASVIEQGTGRYMDSMIHAPEGRRLQLGAKCMMFWRIHFGYDIVDGCSRNHRGQPQTGYFSLADLGLLEPNSPGPGNDGAADGTVQCWTFKIASSLEMSLALALHGPFRRHCPRASASCRHCIGFSSYSFLLTTLFNSNCRRSVPDVIFALMAKDDDRDTGRHRSLLQHTFARFKLTSDLLCDCSMTGRWSDGTTRVEMPRMNFVI